MFSIAVIHDVNAEYQQAIRYYLQSDAIQRRLKLVKNKDFAYTYIYLGNIYNSIGKIDSAEYYYKRGEERVLEFSDINLFHLYYSYGLFYSRLGDCKSCIVNFEKAIGISQSKESDARFVRLSREFTGTFAAALVKCQQYNQAIGYYKQLLDSVDKNWILVKVGYAYLQLNKPDSALYFFTKARLTTDTSSQIKLYNGLGEAYAQLQKPAQSLDHFNRAIRVNRRHFGTKNVDLAQSYTGIARLYETQNDFPKALTQYQAAIGSLHGSFASSDVYQNPADLTNVISRLDFFKLLRQKAEAFQKYYVLKTKNPADLKAAWETYQLAIRQAENLRLSYDNDEAKLFFTQQVFPVYEQAVTVAFLLFEKTGNSLYAEQAFVLSEKSKAAVLAETLRGVQINQQKGVPAGLLQQERNLRRTLTQLTVASIEAQDSSKQVVLKDQIRDNEISLARLVRKLDANEKYYQLKYNTQPVSVAQLQKRVLDDKTALVEYFFGDQNLYAFVITATGFRSFHLWSATSSGQTDSFRRALAGYKTSLYEHRYSPEQPVWAHDLYHVLVSPLVTALSGKTKLILVPDGELSYIPFEALVPDANRSGYLLHDYVVRYAYSAVVLQWNHSHHKQTQLDDVLAMAPFARQSAGMFRDAQMAPLPASRQEVEKIGGRVYMEEKATKDVFLKMASRSGIIHLATHAKADSDDPLNSYITFYPQQSDSITGYRLYTSELYNLQLDSVKLVVLSACETGGGQLVRGEGVMSLARGFAYAGCPNIAMTLWRAEDQATAQITTRMHEYLKKGYAKDEALTQAKRDYLNEAPAPRRIPYFWANVVLIGDDEPVYRSYRWYWIVGIVSLFLVVGSGLLWRIFSRRRKKTVAFS